MNEQNILNEITYIRRQLTKLIIDNDKAKKEHRTLKTFYLFLYIFLVICNL